MYAIKWKKNPEILETHASWDNAVKSLPKKLPVDKRHMSLMKGDTQSRCDAMECVPLYAILNNDGTIETYLTIHRIP